MPKRSRKDQPSEQVPVKVETEANDETAFFYVNFIEVGNTAYDFTISAARLLAKFPPEVVQEVTETKVLKLGVDVQIVFPVGLLPGLIRALTTQKETYEKNTGTTITEPGGKNE